MWSGPRLASPRRRGPLLGAGSQLPFPLRSDLGDLADRRGAGVPARGPTFVRRSVAEIKYMYFNQQARPREGLRFLRTSEPMRYSERPQPALGEAIRQLRRERGLTQEDLAENAGLTAATLSLIERGRANPTWDTVKKIATALNSSMGELGSLADKDER